MIIILNDLCIIMYKMIVYPDRLQSRPELDAIVETFKPLQTVAPLHRCTLKTVRQTVGRSTLISPVASKHKYNQHS